MSAVENPPAFPVNTQGQLEPSDGMALRDWFAGNAGPAPDHFTIAKPTGIDWMDENVTTEAWSEWTVRREVAWRCAFADAMLKARTTTPDSEVE